jgi:hypothetical protein
MHPDYDVEGDTIRPSAALIKTQPPSLAGTSSVIAARLG